jgi:hypothetical protein
MTWLILKSATRPAGLQQCPDAIDLTLHREDEVEGIGHCFEIITTAPWSAKLSAFAWRLVAGFLPIGKATGRKMAPEFDTPDDTCMLCDAQGAGDTIEHVFGCCSTLHDYNIRQDVILIGHSDPRMTHADVAAALAAYVDGETLRNKTRALEDAGLPPPAVDAALRA